MGWRGCGRRSAEDQCPQMVPSPWSSMQGKPDQQHRIVKTDKQNTCCLTTANHLVMCPDGMTQPSTKLSCSGLVTTKHVEHTPSV